MNDQLEITRVIVITKNRKVKVYYKTPDSSTRQSLNIKTLKQDILKKIRGVIHIDFEEEIDRPLPPGFLEDYREDIFNYLVSIQPSTSACLANSKWVYENDEFTIYVATETEKDFLRQRRCDSIISDLILYLTGCKKAVYIEKDPTAETGTVAKLEEEREIVKSIMAEYLHSSANLREKPDEQLILGKTINSEPTEISRIPQEAECVTIHGEIFNIDIRKMKNGKTNIVTLSVTDYTSSIFVKAFVDDETCNRIDRAARQKAWIKVSGSIGFDEFLKANAIIAKDINLEPKPQRTDVCERKRIELHLHTRMSAMDGVNAIEEYIKRAALWGHEAIAVTDHGVVQAFPEAYEAGRKYGIKVIYGVEAYVFDDNPEIIQRMTDPTSELDEIVVFDIETTGLSPLFDEIIEIGAVKIKDGKIIDTFSSFVNPGRPVSAFITKLTGITNEMVKDAPRINEVLPGFLKFVENTVVAAHNAGFDTGFINASCARNNIKFDVPVMDTLLLARSLLPDLKNHKLDTVSSALGIKLINHHRAVEDAQATSEVLIKLLSMIQKQGFKLTANYINTLAKKIPHHLHKSHHATILAKDEIGLKNLYKLISLSHLEYFYRQPRIPKRVLQDMRDGLLIGSACESGELFQKLLSSVHSEDLYKTAAFYDFLELQPLENNKFLINNRMVPNLERLKEIYKVLLGIGEKLGIPVVATGDVHFLDEHDSVFRKVLMTGQGYEDAETQPPLYFHTTQEMLDRFDFLGKSLAEQIVIDNPARLAGKVKDIKPIPDELYPPVIEGADETIKTLTLSKAEEIYGNPLPIPVAQRLNKELESIIKNGFSVIYLIAHKLVKKSLEDGYLVGSRGSVGSSLVATMCGITEVNPLPPHYVCKYCRHSEFDVFPRAAVGPDLPDRSCPICGKPMAKDGYDIPFEVFLGFEGDKVPDIDLNFSGEYQPVAHKYTEELFGKDYVYRAGTISTIAEKTAYGFVKGYMEDKKLSLHKAEIERLARGCTGVKRTTGQHPGGLMVVPKNKEIYDFTPIQHPADDKLSGVITTHFDYHAISSRLIKLDILGHDDPTVLRMLQDITGVDPKSVPLDDKKTMGLFTGTESLNLIEPIPNLKTGTLGIPEFGTKFVRQMLEETKPTTFAELIRISGLSHGTDVWLNNASDLIRDGTATLSEVICTRDDIMNYLLVKDMEPKLAFSIMERVRKGKGLDAEHEKAMRDKQVPEWFIGSCKKIKYMFPKAHAVAYVIMAFRIAFFKVHYPEAFYATYFTVRADDFDAGLIIQGPKAIRDKIRQIEEKGNSATAKEKNLLTILEVALEMLARGLNFLPVDLYKSDSRRFIVTAQGLLPPFTSLQGLGESAAKNIVAARTDGIFLSIEDLKTRAKLNKSAILALQNHGCLAGLPDTNQLDLFSLA